MATKTFDSPAEEKTEKKLIDKLSNMHKSVKVKSATKGR